MSASYAEFLATKLSVSKPSGLDVPVTLDGLFPFQRDLVTWALRRGKAALFASTGTGKTRMQLAWSHYVQAATGGRVLILAPLSVARQTEAEGVAIGVTVKRVSDGCECAEPGIYVTNYDRLHRFDTVSADVPLIVDAIVLDESSIIKHHTAKTLGTLLDRFRDTPYKLACSATPSPNDYTELGTHAEFLGVCTRSEMLAEFFCHDGGDTSVWRLKGHARAAFWRWMSHWAAMLRKPSDLGYDNGGYDLPALRVTEHMSPADPAGVREAGLLFAEPASTLSDRRTARRVTMDVRVSSCVQLVTECTCKSKTARHSPRCNVNSQYVIWCELNAEQDAIRHALGDECVSITGSQDSLTKELLHEKWLRSEARVLVTKPSIFGFGLNWQHAHNMAFVGVTDSFESYHQAVRRMWRFGQKSEVNVHLFYNELEGDVLRNLKRKEDDARKMGDELSIETREMVRAEVRGLARSNAYEPERIVMPTWLTRREADYE